MRKSETNMKYIKFIPSQTLKLLSLDFLNLFSRCSSLESPFSFILLLLSLIDLLSLIEIHIHRYVHISIRTRKESGGSHDKITLFFIKIILFFLIFVVLSYIS